METKAIISAAIAVVMALAAWNLKTTHDLSLAVARLEVMLRADAMVK